MTNLLFVSYSSKISSNRVNVALPYICVPDFVSLIYNLRCFEQPAANFLVLFENPFKPRQLSSATSKQLSTTSKQCFELSTTSKQYFEQLRLAFLVCSLIFI
ncbi:S1 RNA-binding domain-containing protein [Streptococcus pneumoniae]|nr:S1 RNA-binding domain-containing protein [Streptococcus pneumoniae]